MANQNGALARHPALGFQAVAAGFAEKHITSPGGRQAFLSAVGAWSRLFGVARHESTVLAAVNAGEDGFWHANWIFKSLFYPEISATWLLEHDGERDPAVRAAKLVAGAMRFRHRFERGEVPTEHEAGRPLDMRRYAHFFSRMTRTHLERGKLRHEIVDVARTDYIICWIRGAAFRITVLSDDGEPLAWEALAQSLRTAIEDAGKNPATPVLGLLSTYATVESAAMLRDLWARNARAGDVIDNAILSLSIDLDAAPTECEEAFRAVHAETFDNRDFRKSLQIVVTGNGHAGIVVNPHAGLGGTLSARLASELFACAASAEAGTGRRTDQAPERLALFWQPGKAARKAYLKLDRAIRKKMYPRSLPTTVAFPGVGKAAFAAVGASADAAFHCALSMAYFRAFGRIPEIGNFINLRSLEHGDIWRYNSTSDAMRRFVQFPGPETLDAAMSAHRALAKAMKGGSDEFYLGAMLLKKLINDGYVRFSSFVTLLLLCQVFVRDFMKRFMAPDLWVSNIPSLRGIRMAGRPATTLSYLAPRTFGGHYMIFEDHVKVCLLSSPRSSMAALTTSGFYRELGASFAILNECLQSLAAKRPGLKGLRVGEGEPGSDRQAHQMRLAPDA